MKFTIDKKTLEKAMAHSVGIIDRKQTVPVLGYSLFSCSAAEGTLTITSTNMDMTIVDRINCEVVEKTGAYCLPSNLLYDITKKMRAGAKITVEFKEEDHSVTVASNKIVFSLHCMEASDFPPIADASYLVQFSLSADLFKKAVDTARVAMLQDNTRFHLNGIHLHYENDLGVIKLRFVATDLFRIACSTILAPSEIQNMPAIIVSKRAINEILKLIENCDVEEINISVSDSKIAVRTNEDFIKTEFSSRLINGSFPEYKSALEVSNDKILVVDTKEFIEAIDRVSTVVMDSTNSVKLNLQSNKLILTGVSRELGSAEEEIPASFNALKPMEICFNSKYLMEILGRIETKQVRMKLAESSSSTIIEPSEVSDLEMQFAIMPIEIVKN